MKNLLICFVLLLANNFYAQESNGSNNIKINKRKNIEKTDKTLIDVSSYANGIYIINVTSENGQVYTKKLIKN